MTPHTNPAARQAGSQASLLTEPWAQCGPFATAAKRFATLLRPLLRPLFSPVFPTLLSILGAGPGFMLPAAAHAQGTWPQRAVHIVVPYPPGGVTDLVVRQIAPSIAERLGQPVIVDNRPGAAGMTGTVAVARAPADGYQLLATFDNFSNNAYLFRNAGYDPVRDFAPIVLLMRSPQVLIVPLREGAPRTLAEFVDQAKASKQPLQYASAGAGSSGHLTGELFRIAAGVELMPVHYKGGGPALNDILGGQIDAMFTPLGLAAPHLHGGKLTALAVTSSQRSAQWPDVPAVAERYPGFEAQAWVGLLAPAHTPGTIIELMNAEVNRALLRPEVRDKFLRQGYEAVGGTAASFGQWLNAEALKWGRVIRERHITLD